MAVMTFKARFDGQVFLPELPLELEKDTVYTISVEKSRPAAEGASMWDYLREVAGTVNAPEDWSAEHDHYIHGTPKRSGRADP